MKCKVNRKNKEGIVKINGALVKYRVYRIKIVYLWQGYIREVEE